MKISTSLASIALAAFTGTAAAQDFSAQHDSPGYAEEINDKIANACPSAVLGTDDHSNIACATVAWQSAYNIATRIADYLTQEAGKSVTNFDAGLNKGILLICEMGANRMDARMSALDQSNPSAVLSYLNQSHDTAQECMTVLDKVEANVGISIEPAAQNHVIDLLNCQINPEQCKRSQEFNL